MRRRRHKPHKKHRKVKPQKSLHELRIMALRRASIRWLYKYRCKNAAKVKVEIGKWKNGNTKYGVFYKCAHCKELHTKVQVDHIVEIGGENGFTDWNTFIPALFCELDGLQVLCVKCHKEKTSKYLEKRAKNKAKKRD